MTTKADHTERTKACIHQAKRFIEATGHGGVDGKGSAWKMGIDLDVRIMHASTARMFAELAVHEAYHAKSRNENGPSALQIQASKLADQTTRLMEQLAYDVARGVFRAPGLDGFKEIK